MKPLLSASIPDPSSVPPNSQPNLVSDDRPSKLIRRNTAANIVAVVWAAGLNLLFIPIYVRLLGVEAYGLVGFYAAIQSALALLDLGLTPTMSRQMAYYSAHEGSSQEARNLVRSLEYFYWAIAIAIGVAVTSGSDLFATRWLDADQLAPSVVKQAVVVIGVVLAFQWPASFYVGGLQGLQRQVASSVASITMTTVRHGGAVLVLLLVSPTIHAYFLWQALVSIGYTIGLTWLLWHYMPGKGERAYFELASIQGIWRFAAGMSGIAVLVLVINQSDKIILSRMLPLGQFGLYVLAAMVAQSLLILANPYINAVFPRFTQLAAIGDRAGQSSLYHFTAQAITVSILVVGLIIVVYAREIVGLWTQNQATAELVAPVLRMLVAGNIFYISQATIFRLALAHGWTRLNIAQGTVVALVYIPTLVALTVRLGPLGAGWAWLALNVLTAPIFVFRAMKRLLPGEYLQWLGRDFLLPLLCATVPLVCVRPFVSPDTPQVVLLLAIAAVGFIAIIAASLAAPAVRAYVLAGVTYLAARAT